MNRTKTRAHPRTKRHPHATHLVDNRNAIIGGALLTGLLGATAYYFISRQRAKRRAGFNGMYEDIRHRVGDMASNAMEKGEEALDAASEYVQDIRSRANE